MRLSKQTELAKALNRGKATISDWSKEPWWPNKANDGTWDVDECRRAIEANVIKLTKPLYPPGDSPATVPASSSVAALEDDALLAQLDSPTASAVEMLDAALRLAARRVAQAGRAGQLDARAVTDLTRASEELRRAKDAALDLDEREKRVIDRDVAAGAVGDLVERLLGILNNLATLLPARVEEWREDPHHHNLSAKDRARVVMEWFEAQARPMRVTPCDLVEAALAQAEKDAAG